MGGEPAADNSCKGCREEFRITEERIDKILSSPMFLADSGNCVPDSVYAERLELCRACPKLIEGHTCALCGCLVKIAAKLKDRSCPAPGNSGWGRFEDDCGTGQ